MTHSAEDDSPGRGPPRAIYDLVEADYPAWEGRPKRTMVICTQPRSGSTLLGEVLHAAGACGCPLEYFHRGFRPTFTKRWGGEAFPDYLRAVYRHRTDPTGTLGVKLFWPDVEELLKELDPEATEGGARERGEGEYRKIHSLLVKIFPNPTFIYLTRHDCLRQAVSALVATQTEVWRRIPEVQEKPPVAEPSFDYRRITELLALGEYCRKSWEGFFGANGRAAHQLAYEDLSDRYDATVRALFTALDCPDVRIAPPRLRRQADRRSEIMVRRFLEEMRARSSRIPDTNSSDG